MLLKEKLVGLFCFDTQSSYIRLYTKANVAVSLSFLFSCSVIEVSLGGCQVCEF